MINDMDYFTKDIIPFICTLLSVNIDFLWLNQFIQKTRKIKTDYGDFGGHLGHQDCSKNGKITIKINFI